MRMILWTRWGIASWTAVLVLLVLGMAMLSPSIPLIARDTLPQARQHKGS